MAAPVAHVIKRSLIDSSGVQAADPSLLTGALRIPRDSVAADTPIHDEAARIRRRRLLRTDHSEMAPESFEVFTRNIDDVRLPRGTAHHRAKEVEPTALDVEAMWQDRLEREVERARLEGFEEGTRTKQAEMNEQVEESIRHFAEHLAAIQASWENHLKRSEPHLVQLAFRIARVVLDAPLPDEVRRVSETVIAEAVERMANGVPVDIVLHPVNYLRMQECGIEEQLSSMHSKLRWRTDPEMKQNEWSVQSSRSATRRLEAELLDQLERELSPRDSLRTDQDEG